MNIQPRLIGITGYARHGKGTIAKVLAENGYTVLSFAEPVRQFALALNPIVYMKGKEYMHLVEYLDMCGNDWEQAKINPEVRRLLQHIGTNAAKPIFGDDCWARIGIETANKIISRGGKVCFDDMRFPIEEGEAIINYKYRPPYSYFITGHIWRVTRFDKDGKPFDNGIGTDHPSEAQVKNFVPDEEILNDGSPEDLARKVREILRTYEVDSRKPV